MLRPGEMGDIIKSPGAIGDLWGGVRWVGPSGTKPNDDEDSSKQSLSSVVYTMLSCSKVFVSVFVEVCIFILL